MKFLLCCSKIFYIKSKSTQNRVLLLIKLNIFIPKISDKIKTMLYIMRRKLNIFSILFIIFSVFDPVLILAILKFSKDRKVLFLLKLKNLKLSGIYIQL